LEESVVLFWDHTLLELFEKGGVCMWPLLACSIVGLAIVLERLFLFLWLRLDFDRFIRRLEPILRSGHIEEAKQLLRGYRSPVALVASVYLAHAHSPQAIRDEVVSREGSKQVARLERRMNWLATVASISTLLGLLGTVTGLVSAFHEIELKAGQVQPGDLAAGIWEALITTVNGLVIAIPCMAAYQLLDHWAGAVALQMQWIAAHLNEWLQSEPPAVAREPTSVAASKPLPARVGPS
jgi:biopolymer transport protein ExbB